MVLSDHSSTRLNMFIFQRKPLSPKERVKNKCDQLFSNNKYEIIESDSTMHVISKGTKKKIIRIDIFDQGDANVLFDCKIYKERSLARGTFFEVKNDLYRQLTEENLYALINNNFGTINSVFPLQNHYKEIRFKSYVRRKKRRSKPDINPIAILDMHNHSFVLAGHEDLKAGWIEASSIHSFSVYEGKNQNYIISRAADCDLCSFIKSKYWNPHTQLFDLCLSMIEAIAVLHLKKLSHTDIKHENILVTKGKQFDFTLTDFGNLEHFKAESDLPFNNEFHQTAPESFESEVHELQGVCAATDYWSIGVIILISFPLKGTKDYFGQFNSLKEEYVLDKKASDVCQEELNQLIDEIFEKNGSPRYFHALSKMLLQFNPKNRDIDVHQLYAQIIIKYIENEHEKKISDENITNGNNEVSGKYPEIATILERISKLHRVSDLIVSNVMIELSKMISESTIYDKIVECYVMLYRHVMMVNDLNYITDGSSSINLNTLRTLTFLGYLSSDCKESLQKRLYNKLTSLTEMEELQGIIVNLNDGIYASAVNQSEFWESFIQTNKILDNSEIYKYIVEVSIITNNTKYEFIL